MRENGFYWIIINHKAKPEVALWDGDEWLGYGWVIESDTGVQVLSERIPEPSEPDSSSSEIGHG